jgi:hypothetical protein
MSGKLNTNKFCTREMAACNFLPKYASGVDRSNAAIACNETVRNPLISSYVPRIFANGFRIGGSEMAPINPPAQRRRRLRDVRHASAQAENDAGQSRDCACSQGCMNHFLMFLAISHERNDYDASYVLIHFQREFWGHGIGIGIGFCSFVAYCGRVGHVLMGYCLIVIMIDEYIVHMI